MRQLVSLPASPESGLAHIREVLAQIQTRLHHSSTETPPRLRATSPEPLGVPIPPAADDEDREREEQIAREAVEDRAGEARLRGPFES